MSDIFVSYAREDKERIRALVEALEQLDWSVFWDNEIPPGLTWDEFIGGELGAARCVLVAWSEASVDSRYVREEAGDGLDREILIPILLEDVRPPFGFSRVHALDLSVWDGLPEAPEFAKLVEGLSRILGQPAGHRELRSQAETNETPTAAPQPTATREPRGTTALGFLLKHRAAAGLVLAITIFGVWITWRALPREEPDAINGVEEPPPAAPTIFVGGASVLPGRKQEELRIHYLNVGSGSCTLVECPGDHAPPMIIDCGSLAATEGDLDRFATGAYVERILANHLQVPNLVLSHADNDHYSLVPRVLRDTQLQHIWQGGRATDYTGGDHGDERTSDFPDWFSGQVAGGATVHTGFPANWHHEGRAMGADLDCGHASVSILTVNTGSSKNAQSLVLKIRYGDFAATFTGDAEGATERAALENQGGAVKTTVLTASGHGSRTRASNSSGWARATAPEVVIYSAGNKFGHPQCDVVERFEASLATARRHPIRCGDASEFRPAFLTDLAEYVTETNGTIVVTSNGRSPLSLLCIGLEGCEAQITH